MEVHNIDTSSSSDVQLSGNTLSFTTAPNVFSEGDHYILMDAGVVVSPSNCAAGTSFVGISDSSTWTFTAACPVGYADDYGFGRCLYVHKQRTIKYPDAREYCRNIDGRIFQLDNAADVIRMKTILERARNETNLYFGMWVGLTDETTEGTFIWEDGTPFASGDFSDWAPQPYDNNSKRRDCVLMKPKFDWQWVVRNCGRAKNLFVCEPN
ncbi:alpha-N-acetylgalactosamine-specific lectin-like [Branchiostoma lanceolatum]|uniref:alpha-N-acetylgalactosamine-specific lectin-like n=1 Tax=Branchiostoma lanceolatum TaxID=7740 RepID=UPI0034561268